MLSPSSRISCVILSGAPKARRRRITLAQDRLRELMREHERTQTKHELGICFVYVPRQALRARSGLRSA